ncbi:MAG: MBG domain-containing protein [Oscillospiraceae bacterium]
MNLHQFTGLMMSAVLLIFQTALPVSAEMPLLLTEHTTAIQQEMPTDTIVPNTNHGEGAEEITPLVSSDSDSTASGESTSDAVSNVPTATSDSGAASESLPPVSSSEIDIVLPKSDDKTESNLEKLPNIVTFSALSAGGNINSVGGGTLEYHSGTPHIEIVPNSATRTYGDAFVPNGITIKCYGLSEGDVSLNDFTSGTYEILSVTGIAQNSKTPVGNYTAYCTSSIANININGNPITVASGEGYSGGTLAVNKRAITITADTLEKAYGDEDPALTYTVASGSVITGDVFLGSLYRVQSGAETEKVGVYEIKSTLSNTNYTISYISGSLEIKRGQITVTGTTDEGRDVVREYGSVLPTVLYTITGLRFNDTVNDAGNPNNLGTVKITCGAKSISAPGNYAISVAGLGDTLDNYNVNYVQGNIRITKRVINVAATTYTKEYGEADETLSCVVTAPNAAKPDKPDKDADGSSLYPIEYILSRETGEAVGVYPISAEFTPASKQYYDFKYTPANVTIAQAPLTITANDETREYGDDNPTFSVTYQGFKNGEDKSVLTGELKLLANADKFTNIGKISIKPSGLTSKNYKIKYVDGTLNIDARQIMAMMDAKTKVYGTKDEAMTYKLSEEAIDTVNSPLVGVCTRVPGENVGTYRIMASFANTNYDVGIIPANYTITAAALSIRVNNETRIYGDKNPKFSLSYCGFVSGDIENVVTGTPVFNTAANEKSFVGSYDVNVSGLTSKNYDIAFDKGTLEITPRALTVALKDKSQVYGAEETELTYSLSQPLIDSEGSPLVVSMSRAAGNDVGCYSITGKFINSNYSINVVDGEYVITSAGLVITVNDASRVYGGANPDFTVSYNGLQNGDTAADLSGKLAFVTSAERKSAVGSYTVSASGLKSGTLSPSGSIAHANGECLQSSPGACGHYVNGNYDITYAKGNLAITPRHIIVSADNKTKVYGEADAALTYSFSELLIDETNSPIVGTLTRAADENVGGYAITGEFTNSNYSISFVPGNYKITPAPLTVTVTDKERAHGGENPEFEVAYDGFKNEEKEDVLTGELIFTTGANSASDGGEYTVSASGISSKNYTITFVNGKLTVQPAPITEAPAPLPIQINPITGNSFLETYFILPIVAAALALTLLIQGVFAYLKKRKRAKQQNVCTNKFNPQNKK